MLCYIFFKLKFWIKENVLHYKYISMLPALFEAGLRNLVSEAPPSLTAFTDEMEHRKLLLA